MTHTLCTTPPISTQQQSPSFYAPLWGDDPSGVHAAANEQQAIGRVFRIGQRKDAVIHRLLAVGPKGQDTIEQRVVDRNTSEHITSQAVNT